MASYTGLVTVDISSFEAFLADVLGNSYDVDGLYGAQCVDMAKLLAGNAGRTSPYWLSRPDGYAYQGWTDIYSREYNGYAYFDFVYDKSAVIVGDLVVLNNTSSNPYGHIAFATTNWNAGTTVAPLLGQNQENPSATVGYKNTITNVNVTTFLGAFRFRGWQTQDTRKSKFPFYIYARRNRERRQPNY